LKNASAQQITTDPSPTNAPVETARIGLSIPAAPIVLDLNTAADALPISGHRSIQTAFVDHGRERVQGDRQPLKLTSSKSASSSSVPANSVSTERSASSAQSESGKAKRDRWVKPLAIVSQLESLSKIPVTQTWATEVQQLITLLLKAPSVSSRTSSTILEQLSGKVLELDQIINVIHQQFDDLQVAQTLISRLRRLRYDMEKRIVIWRSIEKLPTHTNRISDMRLASRQQLRFDNLDAQWQSYLKIPQLQNALESLTPNAAAKKAAARLTLARMVSPVLSRAQRNYLDNTVSATLISNLKEVASGDVDQYKLLKAIEWNEQNPSGVASHYINDQFQNLMWSQNADRQLAAAQLQAHYRNANVRLAVSQNMLNRLIPASPAVNEPVREQVLGADVRGRSQIRNRLSVQLVEDPSRIALQLHTDGEVDSNTVAKRSGFEIRNEGIAKFQAFKKFTLDRMGKFSSDSPVASAQAKQRLIGIRSKLDPFPVVNWIARKVAKKKLAQQTPEATMLLEQKIEQSASLKLQQGVESQVAQMQAYLKVNLLEPLVSMDLNPEALQLATTRKRIVMRYRLAGIDQMAADSPRPADSEFDYLSMQLHQSLLNNAIERIEIESQTFTPQSLLQHLSEVIGFNPQNAQADNNRDAEFVFANYDAIRIDFVDGKVRIELNLKSLQVGKGKKWRNITISSTYAPTVIGSQVRLTQEGRIGVKGKRFRIGDQIAVRAIFKVVLPASYQFDTVPKKLADRLNGYALEIRNLNIADGWVGLTYDEVSSGEFPHWSEFQSQPQIYEASRHPSAVRFSDGAY
jgi:hypothetical protein